MLITTVNFLKTYYVNPHQDHTLLPGHKTLWGNAEQRNPIFIGLPAFLSVHQQGIYLATTAWEIKVTQRIWKRSSASSSHQQGEFDATEVQCTNWLRAALSEAIGMELARACLISLPSLKHAS